jgi:hypothetical protein
MKNKKTILITSIALFSILIIIFIFVFSYYSFINTTDKGYEKNIRANIKNINEINNSVVSCIKGQSIDAEKSRKELPEKTSSLLNIKNTITTLSPTEKHAKSHEYLVNGLTNNIHIYEQIVSILNNPESNDIDKSLEALKKYKNACMQNYSLFHIKTAEITLSENTLKYINNCTYYVDELVNLKKDREIRKSQYTDFVNEMDEILSSFIEIKMDFSYFKDKIDNKSMTYENALSEIDKIKTEFVEIKNQFSKITVPSKGISSYNLLLKTFDNYYSYLQNYRYALSTESTEVFNNTSKKKLDSLYIEAGLNYKIMNTTYNEFIQTYSYFKESNK